MSTELALSSIWCLRSFLERLPPTHAQKISATSVRQIPQDIRLILQDLKDLDVQAFAERHMRILASPATSDSVRKVAEGYLEKYKRIQLFFSSLTSSTPECRAILVRGDASSDARRSQKRKAEEGAFYEVDKIVGHRINEKTGKIELKMHYATFDDTHNDWRPEGEIQDTAPTLYKAYAALHFIKRPRSI